MTTEIIVAVVSVAVASVGSLFFALFLRKKYDTEVQRMNTETEKRVAEAIDDKLNDAEKIQEIFVSQIESSQEEIKRLRKTLNDLKKTDEKMTGNLHMEDDAIRCQPQHTKTVKRKRGSLAPKTEKKGNRADIHPHSA